MAGIALVEVRMRRSHPAPVVVHRRHQRSAVGVDDNARSRAGGSVLEEARRLYRCAILHVEGVGGDSPAAAAEPQRLGREQSSSTRHRDVGRAAVVAEIKAYGLPALRDTRVVCTAGQVEHGRAGATGVQGAINHFEESARLNEAAEIAGGIRDIDVVAHIRFAARHHPMSCTCVTCVTLVAANYCFARHAQQATRLMDNAIVAAKA